MADPPEGEPESSREGAKPVDPEYGGLVKGTEGLEEVSYLRQAPGPQFSQEEHRAKATKLLALLLFWTLIVLFSAHFGSIVWLAHNRPNSVEEVTRVFNTWIPVFAGLFGSAATFYFTQGRK
jgi:hypothetical protein